MSATPLLRTSTEHLVAGTRIFVLTTMARLRQAGPRQASAAVAVGLAAALTLAAFAPTGDAPPQMKTTVAAGTRPAAVASPTRPTGTLRYVENIDLGEEPCEAQTWPYIAARCLKGGVRQIALAQTMPPAPAAASEKPRAEKSVTADSAATAAAVPLPAPRPAPPTVAVEAQPIFAVAAADGTDGPASLDARWQRVSASAYADDDRDDAARREYWVPTDHGRQLVTVFAPHHHARHRRPIALPFPLPFR